MFFRVGLGTLPSIKSKSIIFNEHLAREEAGSTRPGLIQVQVVLSPDVPIVMEAKHPVHIIVFGSVTRYSDVMPALTFSHCLRLNTNVNIKYQEELALSRIEGVAAGITKA